jgi:hypothetical protein
MNGRRENAFFLLLLMFKAQKVKRLKGSAMGKATVKRLVDFVSAVF